MVAIQITMPSVNAWEEVIMETLIYMFLFAVLICGNTFLPRAFPGLIPWLRRETAQTPTKGKDVVQPQHQSGRRDRRDVRKRALEVGSKAHSPGLVQLLRDLGASDAAWVLRQIDKQAPQRTVAVLKACTEAGLELDAVAYGTAMRRLEDHDQAGVADLLKSRSRISEARFSERRLESRGGSEEQEAEHVKGELVFYTALLRQCSKQRSPGHSLSIFQEMRDCGVQPDAYCCNHVLHALAENGRIDEARKVLSQMRDLYLLPTTVTYNSLLHCCAKTGDGHGALVFLEGMDSDSLAADIISYNTAMTALAKGGMVDAAVGLLARMRERGVKPDVISYNSVLSACSYAGAWDRALDLLNRMSEDEVEPDIVSFNTVMNACDKAGKSDQTPELLERMEKSNLPPTLVTYNILIRACCRRNAWDEAQGFLDTMQKQGVSPDVVSYNTILSAFANRGAAGKALQIFKEMKVPPDHFSFSAVLAGCNKERLDDDARDLIEWFRRSSVQADAVLYKTLISTCERLDLWTEALEMVEKGRSARVLNGEAYSLLVRASVRRGDAQLARMFYNEMVGRGYPATKALTNLVG